MKLSSMLACAVAKRSANSSAARSRAVSGAVPASFGSRSS
jgi:hypothetical protein